jgi:hypothetical protein
METGKDRTYVVTGAASGIGAAGSLGAISTTPTSSRI